MNKKKLFLSTGAIILTVAGIFAMKARNKFTYVTCLYAHNIVGCTLVAVSIPRSSPFITALGATGTQQAQVSTQAYGTQFYLYATAYCSGSSAVYFEP